MNVSKVAETFIQSVEQVYICLNTDDLRKRADCKAE
jgi:hypothetical protein